jgi:hypothetical protein
LASVWVTEFTSIARVTKVIIQFARIITRIIRLLFGLIEVMVCVRMNQWLLGVV